MGLEKKPKDKKKTKKLLLYYKQYKNLFTINPILKCKIK